MTRFLAAAFVLVLSACHGGTGAGNQDPVANAKASGLGPNEVLHFTGTEPFWSGDVSGTLLTWRTPESQAGAPVAVSRFAGRNGVSFSGTLAGQPFVLAASEAPCSDGMSDKRYPLAVTVQRGGQTLRGCGWTDARPAQG